MKHQEGNIVEGVTQGVILQQVNCQGKMASGVAACIKAKWPIVYEEFMTVKGSQYKTGNDLLGRAQEVCVSPTLTVFNLFSQQFYGREPGHRYTSYDALDEALQQVRVFLDFRGMSSEDVHHPLLGAGLGGGHWPIIAEIINHRLGPNTTLWTLQES